MRAFRLTLLLLLVPGTSFAQSDEADRAVQDVAEATATTGPGELDRARPERPGSGAQVARSVVEVLPSAPLADPPPGAEGAEVTFVTFGARATLPLRVRPDTVVFDTATYELLELGGLYEVRVPVGRVVAIKDLLGIRYDILPELIATATGQIALASDFVADLSTRDLQGAGALLVDWRIIPAVTVGLGAGVTSTSSAPIPIPSLHLRFTNNTWFEADLVVPSRGVVSFRPHERIALGVRATLSGAEYHVAQLTSVPEARLKTQTLYLGATGSVRIVAGLRVELDGGYTALHKLKLIDAEGEDVADLDLENGPFVRGGLLFNL